MNSFKNYLKDKPFLLIEKTTQLRYALKFFRNVKINKMSNTCSNVVLGIFNHIYITGGNLMNKRVRKNYKITFIPSDSGKLLKDILEQSFKEKNE